MPNTNVNYHGIIPPRMLVKANYRLIPNYSGSEGGESPATPVPVAVVLKQGTIDIPYSETISAQGGTSPYTYTVLSGDLPTSLSLDGSTGIINGTPSEAGTFAFTIKVTDTAGDIGSQNFSITIAAPSASGAVYSFSS